MATAIIDPYKNRKRKRRVFGQQELGSVLNDNLKGPFRDNIRLFLQEFGDYENYSVFGNPVWSSLLLTESNDSVLPLYIIEETATHHSVNPFCSHCKFVGWGHHFVSKRKYHIIIPTDDNWNKPLKGNCIGLQNHLLHGLIHCNGYGHLLSLNRLSEDSNSLNGCDIMDLWDRICSTLQTRKISVSDYSKKKAVDLRLLHGVAYGTTWFGKWDYRFGHGSFGVTGDKYNRAIQFLRALKLDKVMNDFKNTVRGRRIEQMVTSYRRVSESQLDTVSDLLQFILAFNSTAASPTRLKTTTLPVLVKHASSRKTNFQKEGQKLDKPISLSTFVSSLAKNNCAKSDCRWPARRVEFTVTVIVDLLNENRASDELGTTTMSRHELRLGARNHIGDTGLIDYVLKFISCVSVGDQIVSRSINPLTKVYEFSIHDIVEEADQSGREPSTFASSLDSRWPKQRLEHVAQVIANILKENKAMGLGSGTMSRQELRNRARQCIGDTGLIDFVLKSINSSSMIGNQIVSRSKNPSTRLIEFAIREENMVEPPNVTHQPGQDVYVDILFLYKNVLLGYPEWDSVSLATRVVLDSKHFVKEWELKERNASSRLMFVTCRVLPSFDELESELTRPLCPGEVVMVPRNMRIGELKGVAQCALRDTYCVMEEFVVTQIGGLKKMDEGRMLSWAVGEEGAQVWVRGSGLDLETELRYEGGPEDGKLECVCGARVDDGERMVACDECDVWQHTRCRGIDDDEPAPTYFLCYKCVVQHKQQQNASI